ncbi:P-loop containing nucleoside triphosphate hydrolase protein [Lentinula raphanica]|nr:P-loop containing nucleoside triphosphate hydrolase protein [Lentinula raphanica]
MSQYAKVRSSIVSNTVLNRHLTVLLLILLGVYTYRDLWAFLKFDGKPLDENEGNIFWFKIASLAIAAVVIPIATPRQAYPPTLSAMTSAEVNPEDTASILSLLTHSYMDAFIFQRYRSGSTRLTQDELPPLARPDQSDDLMPKILCTLDPYSPESSKYLLWGLLRTFSETILALALFASFIAPIGIKEVLRYIEHGSEGATIRPWVWISWLFFGPFLKAILFQLFTYIACRNHVQINGALNYLILQHSLRIRVDSGNSSTNTKGQTNNFVGKLTNLAASDAAEVAGKADVWIVLACFPIELMLCLWFLYSILEWSIFVGYGFMLICLPLPGYIARFMSRIQVTKKQKVPLSVIRMAKLFGWEPRLRNQISGKRREELSFVRKTKLLDVLNAHIKYVITFTCMESTSDLFSSAVFSSMAVFEMLRARIRQVAINILPLIQGKVALDRIDDFLRKTELIDDFAQHHSTNSVSNPSLIGFRNSEFRWLGSSHDFALKFEGEVQFRPRCINLIVGPTGSGKTSLLLALLGEMRFIPAGSDSYYNLPREGGVSYAAQESWIQNDTIRNNILFGSRFDEERYNNVLSQCGLLRDLSLFEAGDMTEIGEKGINLRFARVTLARAVYSSAQTVLLDDPLSALDVHTAKWVVEKCLNGELMRDRAVLLVTHNIALVRPLARHVVHIASDGEITQGTVADVLSSDTLLAAQVLEDEKQLHLDAEAPKKEEEAPKQPATKEPRPSLGALILAEEMEVGHVSWKAFKLYMSGLNKHPITFFWLVVTLLFLSSAISAVGSWFMGYWATQYETRPASSVSVSWFLSIYLVLLVLTLATYSGGFALWILGSIRASQILHKLFIDSIMTSTFRWLDVTPTSRIMTRATADMRSIDDSVSVGIWQLNEITLRMIVHLGSIIVFAPLFLFPGIAISLLGGFFGQVYLSAQLPLRRLMSVSRAPILGNFTAAVAGLVSIRAYGAQDMFLREARLRIDEWFRPGIPSYNANRLLIRWIGIRVDALSGIFTAALGAYLVYGNSGVSAANTGFSVTMAVRFTALSLAWVRLYNATEIEANSLERIKHYIDIEHEEQPTSEGIPPAYWPASGSLEVERLCARYSRDGPEVLHDLTFSVRSGEHIGIVGRTGSGKSSLTLALLRAIPTTGKMIYDGISTDKINLDALRSNITITPQVPELQSGTLRSNLDPFSEHDDSRLNDALRSAGSFALQSEDDSNRLGLDSEIRGGGSSNLSVGQRQIIALARAIVRRSKLLIFDEDHRTDAIIQETLRHELGNDVTLITVAHRLATVMDYDKIMVLDDGKIVEFDSPKKLVEKEGGMFRSLVDESADRAELYRMVK